MGDSLRTGLFGNNVHRDSGDVAAGDGGVADSKSVSYPSALLKPVNPVSKISAVEIKPFSKVPSAKLLLLFFFQVTIGRKDVCEVIIEENVVSGMHCTLYYDRHDNNQLMLEVRKTEK
jgi:hypothetical protein